MSFPSVSLRTAFAPPHYLALPLSGIDLSTSGVKAARLAEGAGGLQLAAYAETRLPSGAYADGEIVDRDAVIEALVATARVAGIREVNASLPETKSYLFEAAVEGNTAEEWRIAVEQRLDELVPLPPEEAAFDLVEVGKGEHGETMVAGIAFARRIVEQTLAVYDDAKITVRALEGETFAMARALLPRSDMGTVMLIDVGKTTTKIAIVADQIPRFAATIGIGGHALTLAVQKHFGVTEEEARKVKAERGIVSAPGNEDYLASMLLTVSAIRDEIATRFTYWQEKASVSSGHAPIQHAVIAGGNASVRGLPEYLEAALHIPVTTGDVFTALASRDHWIPALGFAESLAYGTAIGLALRDTI